MLDGHRLALHEVSTVADHHTRGSPTLLISGSSRRDHGQTVLKNQFRQQSNGIQNLAIGRHLGCCATHDQGATKSIPVRRGKTSKNSGCTSSEMSVQTAFHGGGGPYFQPHPFDIHVKNRLFPASCRQRGVLLQPNAGRGLTIDEHSSCYLYRQTVNPLVAKGTLGIRSDADVAQTQRLRRLVIARLSCLRVGQCHALDSGQVIVVGVVHLGAVDIEGIILIVIEIAIGGIGISDLKLGRVVRDGASQIHAVQKHTKRQISAPRVIASDSLQRGASREHLSHVRHVPGVEFPEVERLQPGAAVEHICHVHHSAGVKLGEVQLFERRAAIEHGAHVGHVGRKKSVVQQRVEGDGPQRRTAFEHMCHIFRRPGIKTADIQIFQTYTSTEHTAHVLHVLGLEVRHIKFIQQVTLAEHLSHRGHG